MFTIPYYYPQFQPGFQLTNLGHGGSIPHHEQITQPRIYPMVYVVETMGLGNMPRQVLGQTPRATPNEISMPPNTTIISGLQKTI